MLLRASGQQENRDYNLSAVTRNRGDGGVPHGSVIRRLVEAAIGGQWETLEALRGQGAQEMGEQRTVDVLTVAAGFNGITRVADATGIPLDAPIAAATEELRRETGIDGFAQDAFMRGDSPSRSPAEGSPIEGLCPSHSPAEGSKNVRYG